MKIGLVADIHANLAALEAVLDRLNGVDLLICAGDMVGYYHKPNEVCSLIRERAAVVVGGNHDAYVAGQMEPNAERRDAYRTDWTRTHLLPENLTWLASLPDEQTLAIDGVSMQVRHASPWDRETYLYPDSPRLADIDLPEGHILVVGHTHHPMKVVRGRGLVVNPGSVGQPRDWKPAASYAILDTTTGDIAFHRAEYDVAAVQNGLRMLHWPESTIDILSRVR